MRRVFKRDKKEGVDGGGRISLEEWSRKGLCLEEDGEVAVVVVVDDDDCDDDDDDEEFRISSAALIAACAAVVVVTIGA